MSIRQGDIFWVSPSGAAKILSDHAHPHVVVQVDSEDSVTVCALTSNLKRAKEPGNVLLEDGEANLSKQSVIVVSKISKVDTSQLGEYIGTLTEQRLQQVMVGMRFLQTMLRHHEKNEEAL